MNKTDPKNCITGGFSRIFRIRPAFALICSLAFVWGCSLPGVIILNDPLTSEEHFRLGVVYEKQKEYDSAIEEYKAACRDIPEAYLYMGNIYFVKKEFTAAERSYRAAVQELSDNPRPFNNLAWLYYTENRKMKDAEALARKAVLLASMSGMDTTPYQDTLNKIMAARSVRVGNDFQPGKGQ